MTTRFYLPSSGAATTTPAFDAAWEDTSIATRLATVTTRINTALGTVAFSDGDVTNKDILDRQYESAPIAAQTIQVQNLTFVARGAEGAPANNMRTAFGARVVSNDGTVVRGTLAPVTRAATEFGATLSSRIITVATTQVISQDGDRIIFEVGAGGDPGAGTHTHNLQLGDDAANDLDAADGDTGSDNPWIEFDTDTIVFQSDAISPDSVTIPIVIPAPTITLTKTISPTPVAVPIVVTTPTITRDQILSPTAVAVPIVIPASTVTRTSTISPSPVAIPIVVVAPSVSVTTVQAYQNLTRLLNPADWGGTPTLILEIHAFTDDAGSPINAHLYNITDSGVVSGSQINSANTVLDRLRSSAFSLVAGSKEYEVRYGGVSGATYTMEDAVLIVSP